MRSGRSRRASGGHAPTGQLLFACSLSCIAAFIPHLHRARTRRRLPLSRRILFCEISKRVTVRVRDRKHRRLVLFQFETRHTIAATTLPHPCHHEFNRVRLLKIFGSRSEQNASTRLSARNRKNAAITLDFHSATPRRRARRFRQRFDSTDQFTIPAQFAAPQSRQN